jgi:hypothetical protein
MSFKYYLYISDSKVDMLLPQIDPAAGAGTRNEFGVNLKVLTAKRVTQQAADQRVARLERVVSYLQEHGDLGDVAEPGQFFWGLLPLRWGPFPRKAESSLVFFGGRDERTVVGLGGSVRHVLGSPPESGWQAIPRSQLPGLLDGLGISSELEDEYVADAVDGDLDRAEEATLSRVREAVDALRGPAQNMEFVAKRLLHGDDVLLGSPVYVALVD